MRNCRPPRVRSARGVSTGVVLALLASLLFVVTPMPVGASGAQPSIPQTVDQLLQLFGVTNIPADFVVVIDTSGSMSFEGYRPYPAVQSAFRTFLGELTSGDHLSLITFDTDPALRYDAPVANAGDRQTAVNALPAVATGAHTDIGSALDSTLTQLERPGASAVDIVLFMTDGIDDPGPGSPYPTTSGPEWTALSHRAAALAQNHTVVAFGAGLAQGSATDIGLVRTVFPHAQIVALPPSQLPEFFHQAIDRARIELLRKPVDQELSQSAIATQVVSVGRLGKRTTFTLRLHSSYAHLPVQVSISGATAKSVDGHALAASLVGGPKQLLLGPGQESPPISVTVNVPNVASGGIGTKTQSAQLSVQLLATASVEPASLLQQTLNVSTAAPVTQPATLTATHTYGLAIWKAILGVVLLILALLLLGAFFRWLVVPPPLVGEFQLSGDLAEARRPVRLSGKRMMIDRKKLPELGVAAVEVFTKPRRRKRVFAVGRQGDFEVQEGVHRFRNVVGETELSGGGIYRIGGIRMSWWREPKRNAR